MHHIETRWHGLREFKLVDPDGYTWTFTQQVSTPAEAEALDNTPVS